MNISDFKSGISVKRYAYSSFQPELINLQWIIDDVEIVQLLTEANRMLGELNAFSQFIPNVDLFIQMHVVKEATTSSRIEGTQTNIEEALQKREEINPEKRDDWQEVQNYIEAMNHALHRLDTLPISTRLFKEIHQILMQGVRGERKLPGEFRTSQNWIGGATLRDAVFIPPIHEDISMLMSDVEKFVNNDEIKVPELIRIAMAHYQFETIHPFLDGNGRIGRLFITLYLVNTNLLSKPTLYLSSFFEKHRELYYNNLTGVRTNNNLIQWLRFFLVGVVETAKNSIQTFKEIIELKENIEHQILAKFGNKTLQIKTLLDFLYKHPICNIQNIEEVLHVSTPTANKIIKNLVELNILQEMTGFKRNRQFALHQYIQIFLK